MRIKKQIFLFGLFFFSAIGGQAQQPFVTDDAEVTDKGKFHLEASSEIDVFKLRLFRSNIKTERELQ